MKVLITGGAGFIGSNLAKKLSISKAVSSIKILDQLSYAGNLANLEGIDNKKLSFVVGDVANGQLMDSLVQNIDIVYHLAAETHVTRSIFDNYQFFHSDVMGTQSVANAILKQSTKRKTDIPLIHLSTSEVYGTAQKEKMDEEHPLNPLSPYAAAKVGADRLVFSYAKTYGINSLIVRPFNQYGPHQHPEKLIPRFITSGILKEKFPIHGDGSSSRDWTHVYDTVDFLESLLWKDISSYQGEVFNIGNDESTSINEIAELINEYFPDSKLENIDNRPGQVDRHTCDSSKAKDKLGWKPKLKLHNSIQDIINWYKKSKKLWENQLMIKDIEIEIVPGKKIKH